MATRLGVCKMTVYRLIHAGHLPALKVGKLYRIEQRHFQAYRRKVRTSADTSSGADGSQA